MKLISIDQARAIWLFTLTDLNPRGKAVERNGIIEIGKRYGFTTIPSATDVLVAREKNEPLKYLQGYFTPKGGEEVTVHLLVYRDGIVADTRSSTEDSHAFIEDLLTWASKDLGLLSHDGLVRSKKAVSTVTVSCERSLALLNPKLARLSAVLNAKIPEAKIAPFELASIGFWTEPSKQSQGIEFKLERSAGAAFNENRYFSSAPLETSDHLKFLDDIEAALG